MKKLLGKFNNWWTSSPRLMLVGLPFSVFTVESDSTTVVWLGLAGCLLCTWAIITYIARIELDKKIYQDLYRKKSEQLQASQGLTEAHASIFIRCGDQDPDIPDSLKQALKSGAQGFYSIGDRVHLLDEGGGIRPRDICETMDSDTGSVSEGSFITVRVSDDTVGLMRFVHLPLAYEFAEDIAPHVMGLSCPSTNEESRGILNEFQWANGLTRSDMRALINAFYPMLGRTLIDLYENPNGRVDRLMPLPTRSTPPTARVVPVQLGRRLGPVED